MATFIPSAAKASAIARPIPCEAPHTIAVRPFSPRSTAAPRSQRARWRGSRRPPSARARTARPGCPYGPRTAVRLCFPSSPRRRPGRSWSSGRSAGSATTEPARAGWRSPRFAARAGCVSPVGACAEREGLSLGPGWRGRVPCAESASRASRKCCLGGGSGAHGSMMSERTRSRPASVPAWTVPRAVGPCLQTRTYAVRTPTTSRTASADACSCCRSWSVRSSS